MNKEEDPMGASASVLIKKASIKIHLSLGKQDG